MVTDGWKRLIPPVSYCRGTGAYPIDAYSEFLPPPRLGWKPYGFRNPDPALFSGDDPSGWRISEYEDARELRPGLQQVARQVLKHVGHLLDGDPRTEIPKLDLQGNPYWPPLLAAAGHLAHERLIVLLPLALSRTQDDKGRVRWTLFGCSEQGPAKPFWRSFSDPQGGERPDERGWQFVAGLLRTVFREKADGVDELRKAGFRILPAGGSSPAGCEEGELPGWAEPFLTDGTGPLARLRYLLTFRPFSRLPARVQKAYIAGRLHLIPSPASLVFWGAAPYLRLREELPLAVQIPLLHAITRHNFPSGLRVPQEGFFHVAGPAHPEPGEHGGPVEETFRRTHRWDKVYRDEDDLDVPGREDEPLQRVLFSSFPDDLDLYDKPQARNVQLWTDRGELLLDGPKAGAAELEAARRTVEAGGLFGYRFLYPAMRVGRHEVYWHRPLAAFRTKGGKTALLPDAPLGYLTAYDADRPKIDRAVELWPRVLDRPLPKAIVSLYDGPRRRVATARNLRKLADAAELFGGPLPRGFARSLLTIARETTLDGWLDALPTRELKDGTRELVEPAASHPAGEGVPSSLTFTRTARRAFETAYWKTIAGLSEGTFLNKNNADCVRDAVTQRELSYSGRQLEPLGDYLLGYYARKIAAAGMGGKAAAGELPFRWETAYGYPWMEGWEKNRGGPAERNLLVVIPGRDRGRAVVMADHYDTAYMADRYHEDEGGSGARLAACGADDNHSATAALMLAAPILLDLSKRGQLGCDVWLVHLTGEEFPADCLGARALTRSLVEGVLELLLPAGGRMDLSGVRVQGVYVADMIAHNTDRGRDVFQISPGTGRGSLWLAYQAHLANAAWNASVPVWNRRTGRRSLPRGRRSPHGAAIPEPAPHLALSGEVRPVTDPRSTLYNTDGQIFSDAGVPVVLFMENYDINRRGYHDTHDTMANIDLDYGAALAAIVIESVARAATETPWE